MTLVIDFPIWARALMVVIGAAIVLSCGCRAKHMTGDSTMPSIRYATTALATSGLVLVLTALARPDWLLGVLLLLAASTLAVQAASAFYWRRGLPPSFHRGTR